MKYTRVIFALLLALVVIQGSAENEDVNQNISPTQSHTTATTEEELAEARGEEIDSDPTSEVAGEGCGCGSSALNRNHDEDALALEENSHGHVQEEAALKYSREANDPIDHPEANVAAFQRTNQMNFIEGGTFQMGTDKAKIYLDGESPSRLVTLDPYYFDVYEVSNSEFELFVNTTSYVTEVIIEKSEVLLRHQFHCKNKMNTF